MSDLVDVHMKAPKDLLRKVDEKAEKMLSNRTKVTLFLWKEWLRQDAKKGAST